MGAATVSPVLAQRTWRSMSSAPCGLISSAARSSNSARSIVANSVHHFAASASKEQSGSQFAANPDHHHRRASRLPDAPCAARSGECGVQIMNLPQLAARRPCSLYNRARRVAERNSHNLPPCWREEPVETVFAHLVAGPGAAPGRAKGACGRLGGYAICISERGCASIGSIRIRRSQAVGSAQRTIDAWRSRV
jgi:hypothetical protein